MTVPSSLRQGSDFAALCSQVRESDLLQRRYASYTVRILLTAATFVGVWFLFAWFGETAFQLLVAGALGLVSTQVVFLGHDGGHQQIAASRRVNRWIGLITGNLLTGLSNGWWMDKHNRHHANPNREDHDPDIGEGVLAFTVDQASRRETSFARALTRNQALLFFPLLLLEALNLHVASVKWLIDNRDGRHRRTELILLGVHVVAYFGAIFTVLPPLQALAFIGVHQAVFGFYLGCSFVTNHTGMPIVASDVKLDFLRRQVLTSRNVRGGWLVDQVFGGLNYQIEHHLFPSMPRCNLRHVRRMVRDYCAEQHIDYAETTLFAAYGEALRYLHGLGAPLRAVPV